MSNCVISDSLLENKHMFSKMLCEHHDEGSLLISDLIQLSPEDTNALCRQFVCINSSEMFQRFCICVIVGWTLSYCNGTEKAFYENMVKRYMHVPQHAQGLYIRIYLDTFYEYALDTFDSPFKSLDDIDKLIRKHARKNVPLSD